ncbi:MAG: ATP phosphoribosyltransferase [Planctomycetota bacterium]|jgi:ATP phosphoribosyltransferase
MNPTIPNDTIRLALPKGRIQEGVVTLLAEAGIRVRTGARGYRPSLSIDGFETKLLKPQNIVEMLAAGSRDLGFAGADWVAEKNADVIELLETGLDPVRIVAASPTAFLQDGQLPRQALTVASEYENLAARWIEAREIDARFVRTYGATEVFPPEDADVIIDNTATGETLVANGLEIIDELMLSSTRLYVSRKAIEDPAKRTAINDMVLCLRAVIEARSRAMVELNVGSRELESVIERLPCMREPTISGLYGKTGFAVRAAVPRADLPTLVPELKARGATDIVVSRCEQIVP